MKKFNYYLIALILVVPLLSYSQNGATASNGDLSVKKNEIKLGFGKLLSGPKIDLEFEHYFGPSTSWGANLALAIGNNDSYYNNLIMTYFRFYFTETRAYGTSGFFAQPSIGFIGGESDDYSANKQFNAFGAGFSLGQKWFNRHGFSLQVSYGGMRRFSGGDDIPEVFFIGDVYMGFRF